MRKPWSQWIASILAGLSLFLTGCGEKRMGETTFETPAQQAPSTALGGPEEGKTTPGYEQGQVGKEQKPSEKQRQERG